MGGVFGRTNYEVDRSIDHENHANEKKDANLTFPVSNKPPKRGKMICEGCGGEGSKFEIQDGLCRDCSIGY